MLAMAGVYSITMGLVERQITIIMTNILLTINVAFTYTISLAGSNMFTARLRVILLTLMDALPKLSLAQVVVWLQRDLDSYCCQPWMCVFTLSLIQVALQSQADLGSYC